MKKMKRLLIDSLFVLIALAGLTLSYLVLGENVQVVRVVSDSMAPAIHRGDSLIFKAERTVDIEKGEILLLPLVDGSGRSYVHRVIQKTVDPNSSVEVVTKGDANPAVDNWKIKITSEKVPVFVATLPTSRVPLIPHDYRGFLFLLVALLLVLTPVAWPKVRKRAVAIEQEILLTKDLPLSE